MYLKALEIHGFKSFADKTRLEFKSDITAIVGPNGSGKSNISDAIRWVMGEQSTKTLRGGKMQDVIFGGTATRSAMGVAQVSLIIDNSMGILPSEHEELTISRKYYRSGDSEYYINREQVRLRDINELLMDTGMGRDGYSIIGQGRIGEIVSGKSEERREVLEEAAGISRFRYRKDEAERRLARTEENLLRINDKIEELELQVLPLKEQAEKAKRYLILRDELREAEVSLWVYNLETLREKTGEIKEDYERSEAELQLLRRELEELYARSEEITRRMRESDIETEDLRTKLAEKEAEASESEAELRVRRAELKNSAETAERMRAESKERQSEAEKLTEQIEEHAERIAEAERRLKEIEADVIRATNKIEGRRMKLENSRREYERLNETLTKSIINLRATDSKIGMLSEMERDYEGFGRAVKVLMKEAQRGSLRGVHGTVAELIRTSAETALAVETALGAAVSNIVVDTQADGRAGIEHLKRTGVGRATFLPLDIIRGGRMDNVPKGEGCVGLAVDLIEFDAGYRGVMENLLGRTLVTETLKDAMRISKERGGKIRIVSLDGQVINYGGSMTGGSASKNTGVLSRANELERLRVDRGAMAKERDEITARVQALKKDTETSEYELQMAMEDMQAVKNEAASVKAESDTRASARRQLELLYEGMQRDAEQRLKSAEDIETGASDYTSDIELKEQAISVLVSQCEELKQKISEKLRSKLETEGKRTRTDKEVQEKNNRLLDAERSCARLEQKKLSADMEERRIADKLWETYELSHGRAKELAKPVENEAAATKRASEIRRAVSSLGNVSIGSIDEYARVSERYEFLAGQRDDVEKSKSEIRGIIGEILTEMVSIFTREFELINKSFSETFTELFGGGRAALVLEDEDDVLGSPIDIRVQPPGKALSTLSLLSGGEMAFVAIALYFAIIKVKPTPFCVMDEIEAALDESNVQRYAEHMRRIATKTQFVAITHRRGTMEEADELYGVTMQERGVSKIVELDLREAEKHMGER